jgi:hypothetical protein
LQAASHPQPVQPVAPSTQFVPTPTPAAPGAAPREVPQNENRPARKLLSQPLATRPVPESPQVLP